MASSSNNQAQMHTNSSYTFIIPIKLTQSNFMLWRTQVLASIRANGLMGFIDGTVVCPRSMNTTTDNAQTVITTPNPEYAAWVAHDQNLMSWMLSSLSEGVLSAVVDCTTSYEVWATLCSQFGAQSRARILQLRTQLQTTRKGSIDVHEYYTRMRTILSGLRAAGDRMSDEDFVLSLLAGLGPDYDSVVTTITSRDRTTSIPEVYSMLLSQENRLEYNSGVANLERSANYAQMRGGSRRNWNNQDRQSSYSQQPYNRYTQGASANQDRNKGKNPVSDEENLKGPCQICFRKNHSANECWHRYKKIFVPNRRREPRAAFITAGESTDQGS